MADVNGISNIDNKNSYNINANKKVAENSADFSSFLGETKTLDTIFEQAAKKYNVSEDLLKAIGKAESNFNTNAVSRCGAQGVMQLMPATAKSLGVSDSFNAEQNIMGGSKYISDLLKKYNGDTRLALAAYNAGSGNVAKYGGIPPFEETQNYVKKVMKFIGQGDVEISSASNKNTGISNVATNNVAINNTPTNNAVTNNSAISNATKSNSTNGNVAVPTNGTTIQSNLSFLLTNDVDSVASELQDLDSLFSYDDYLKFIDLFLYDKKENDAEENNTNYATKDINYNVPIMNLLKDQKLI